MPLPLKMPPVQHMVRPVPPADTTSIFDQRWWLTAAAGDRLEFAEVRWDGQEVARLGFVRTQRLGFKLIDMPPYTRTLSLGLVLPKSKPARRQRNMHAAVADLMRSLPPHDRMQLTLAPEDPAGFSLALAGCGLGQLFTFRMPAQWDVEQQWELLDQKTRNLIRSAGRELNVVEEPEISTLLTLTAQSFGEADRSDREALERLAAAARARNQICTLSAQLPSGQPVAAAVLIWDAQVLYFWQSGRDPSVRRSGANSLLVWRSMLEARRRGLIFDIDGYHSKEAARFVASFGLETKVRSRVVHLSSRGRTVQALGRVFGRGNGFGVQPMSQVFHGN